MKKVIWKDRDGNYRCSLLRDEDDVNVPEIGLPVEPPPIEKIVCEAAMELRNAFLSRGLFTWRDVIASQDGVSSVLLDVLKRKIVEAYKLQELNRNGR